MAEFKTEKDLIKACLKSSREAQYYLYQIHKSYLFGVCLRYVKNTEEAEDILQEGFYKILRDLKQYNKSGDLRAWMRKVMINTALMYIRKYHKVKYSNLEGQYDNYSEPECKVELSSYRTQTIIKLIHQLPLAQQSVFNLKAIDGYDFNEISQILETKESTLRSHFLRARKKLQSLLKKEFNYEG